MDQQLTFFLALAVGLIFGALAVWLMLRAETSNAYRRAKAELAAELNKLAERLSGKDSKIAELINERDQQKAELETQRKEVAALHAAKAEVEARLSEKEKTTDEKLEKLSETFRALSAEALQSNNEAFLHLAKATLEKYQDAAQTDLTSRQNAIDEMMKPLRESLVKVDDGIREIEKSRAAAYAGVTEQVKSLLEVQNVLRSETSNLVNALRTPTVRGRWGEVQLRRVVEMAGMVPHCDFDEQPGVTTEEGRLRPDMVMHLPGERKVVVDSKVSMKAYLEALDAPDEETRKLKMKEHAAQVRSHVRQLGGKGYWDQFEPTPEFVVAFLPAEAFFSAALEQDPELIEFGIEHKVILATPTTLIALLKAVSYGWRQEKLAYNARAVSDLGKTLYDRLTTFTQHLETVGVNLQRTVTGYNRAVGSLESRVLVSARRFQDLGAATTEKELASPSPVDNFPRSLQAVERAVAGDVAIEELLEPEPFDDLEPVESSGGISLTLDGEDDSVETSAEPVIEEIGEVEPEVAEEPVEEEEQAEDSEQPEETPENPEVALESDEVIPDEPDTPDELATSAEQAVEEPDAEEEQPVVGDESEEETEAESGVEEAEEEAEIETQTEPEAEQEGETVGVSDSASPAQPGATTEPGSPEAVNYLAFVKAM